MTLASASHARLPRDFPAMTATAFFMLAICWSPLLPGLLAIESSWAFIASFVLFAALVVRHHGLDGDAFYISSALVMCCLALFLATGSRTLLARTAPLPLLFFATHQTAAINRLPEAICNVLTAYISVGITLSIVGFLYAFSGGSALLSISNPDGRENALYLTTMTNFWVGNIIRPSFIYDEPGAFSFLVCATVALREVLGRRVRTSLVLILGGLITLSLTHLLVAAIFLATRIRRPRTLILITLAVAGVFIAVQQSEELEFVSARFDIEDGKLVGDNRSNQLENLAAIISPEILLFGDVACHARPERTCEEHGDISSSPATPVYRGGLLLLAAQLFVHGSLIIAFFRRKTYRFPALALSVLLLQRPYFEGFGYGFITYMILFLMFKRPVPGRRHSPQIRASDIPPAAPLVRAP